MRKILILIGALALSGCSGVSANVTASQASSSDPTQQLENFVVTDLQAADKIAKANNDTVASTCYEYLIPKVQALQSASAMSTASVAGAASFAEVQRGVTVQINSVKSGLNVACAPLVLDTADTLSQLGLKIGGLAGTVASGGIALP